MRRSPASTLKSSPLLRSLLDAGISLADHQQVREALADADVWGSDETAEVVRARLMCQRIGVEAQQSLHTGTSPLASSGR